MDSKPEVGAGIGRQQPRAADVGHDRDGAPGRDRLGGQQRGGLDQLTVAARDDDAGLLEQRFPADQRRSWAVRCLLAGRGTSAQHGEHRHGGAHPAGGPGELARVAERLDVQHRELGHAVALPPQQHVVPRHVQLVAHRLERGDPDAEPDSCSTMARPRPPDRMTRPATPARGALAANVALRPMPGTVSATTSPIPPTPGPSSTSGSGHLALSQAPMCSTQTGYPR